MASRRRILVVEDLKNWQDILKRTLARDGFEVDIASSFEEGIEKLKTTFYPLAIIDIRLVDYDESNVAGMTILDQLQQLGLGEAMEKVMISAYGTKEQMREAFKHHDVADFILKDQFDRDEFREIVREIFDKRVQANFNLDIILEDGLTLEELLTGVRLEESRLKPTDEVFPRATEELNDLFQRLFYRADSVVLRRISAGHGGSGIVKAEPFYIEGHGEPVIVKFGDYREIDLEYQNYRAYVLGFIGANRATNILNLRRTALLGGIVYSLLGTPLQQIQDFSTFYEGHSVAEIANVLDDLFKVTCANWYADRSSIRHCRLTEEYEQLLELNHVKLERALEDNFPYYLNQNTISFRDLPGKHFVNPVYATKGRTLSSSTYRCTTHGDLNGTNIMVDPHKHTWLIDFRRTGKGHILRDCIELETVVKFMLLRADEFEARYGLEEALISIDRFSELDRIEYEAPDGELDKAFAVVRKVRQIARDLVQPNDDFSEYYMGLLYYSLNTQRFYSLSKVNRLHALLAAGMICYKLGLQPV